MFTGHMNQLPDERYLSESLLQHIKMAFDAIGADPNVGAKTLVEDTLSYTIIRQNCTSPIGKPGEIHQDNIDVHLVLSGQDQIGYSNRPLIIDDETHANNDLYFGPLDNEHYVCLKTGEYAIFYPGEVHKPLCDYSEQQTEVTKAIIKIRIDKMDVTIPQTLSTHKAAQGLI